MGEHRERLLSSLAGTVLDDGAGTGATLCHFRQATRVVAAEPDPAMPQRLAAKLSEAHAPVELAAAAESLPYPDASFDAVIYTLTLCTVADLDRALAEARRVLRPDGRLVVLEHVRGYGRLATWNVALAPMRQGSRWRSCRRTYSLSSPDGGGGRAGLVMPPVDASVLLAFLTAQHPESRALLGKLEKPTGGHGYLGHPLREAVWEKGEGRE